MNRTSTFLFFCLSLISCTRTEDFRVLSEETGPIETNCYLIYGTRSNAAALIDPGWRIDSLMQFIDDHRLELKYIFITHGHIDHIYYVPEVKRKYPEAKLVMHRDDYRDLFTAIDWIRENYGQQWIDNANSRPETKAYIDFDMNLLGEPDIYPEDSQTLKLGYLDIHCLYTPGHSPGGVCYYTGNVLFSGDVLFYRTVGRVDTQHGSLDEQVASVRRLYEMFPDSTIVYPGHMRRTDIGSEKRENRKITLTEVHMN